MTVTQAPAPEGGTSGNLARMRVVIGGHETCGIVRDLAAEFRRRGHDVVTMAAANRFYAETYDYPLEVLPHELRRVLRSPLLVTTISRLWRKFMPEWYRRAELACKRRVLRGAELYINVWADIPGIGELFEYLRSQRTRIASLMMGSDVRDYDLFKEQYGVTRWQFPQEYHSRATKEKQQLIRVHERHADAIFSVPDQMGLAFRSYHHLQVPLQLGRLRYHIPGRDIPRVLHAPSVPHVKGTDVIEDALKTLREEGVAFEFMSVRNVPHANVLELLTDIDVVVDELVCHGPGWLSFEAMASGCAVATRYLASSPPCFTPPVWSIDEHTIVERLRILLTDRELRVRLAKQGRRYVEKNNDIVHVVDQLIRKTMLGREGPHDYEMNASVVLALGNVDHHEAGAEARRASQAHR